MWVPRTLQQTLLSLAGKYSIVTLTGPRQSGKTTLCRMAFPDKPYSSLEAPDVREHAQTDPRGYLAQFPDGAVLDEVQRLPDLLSYLQVEVDERPVAGRFVLSGSANLRLLQSVSQSLAGRTALLELLPMSRKELLGFQNTPGELFDAMVRGSYPALFDRELTPLQWYRDYVGTYVERDVRQILRVGDLRTFQTFLQLCAGRTGRLLNLSSLGADAGVTHATASAWLSVLEASYLVYRLPALHVNVNKRLVKSPKLHFYDSGLVCYLLGVYSSAQLRTHPLRGAVFESWVLGEILRARTHRGLPPRLLHYRDRKGGEVDGVLERGDARVAVEVKSGQTVGSDFFKGFAALEAKLGAEPHALPLEKVVVYGGDQRQNRTVATVLPWSEIHEYDWGAEDVG